MIHLTDTMNNSTKKFLLFGKKDGIYKRGSYHITKRFCSEHENECDFCLDKDIFKNPDKMKDYDIVISTYQSIKNYTKPLNWLFFRDINHILYTRNISDCLIFNGATNGLSVFNRLKRFKYFIPMITDIDSKNIKEPNDISLGFYIRETVNGDAFHFFLDMLKNIDFKINIVTMGDKYFNFENINSVNNHYHTFNNIDFFSRITHYVFPQSAEFMDPFPNTLLEAIQCNKQIICPKIPNRKIKDGIDDILSCINYHKDLNLRKNLDNKNCGLNSKNFKRFYENLFKNDWNYQIKPDEYKTFYDWCSKEL